MALDLKKTLTDTTPIYALVGVADQAVSSVKDALGQASQRTLALREDLAPAAVQTKVTDTVTGVRAQVEALPGTATSRFTAVSGEFENAYTQFATRGEQVVGQLRGRPEVQQVSDRAEQVVGQAQSAVETVRKVAEDTQATALSAVYSGRKQAAQEIVEVAEVVESEAKTSARSNAAKQGAAKKSTKPAAKKAPAKKTTARKSTTSKSTASKSTAAKSTAKKA